MVQKLGIIVPDIAHSQLSYELVNSVNAFVDMNSGVDVVLFVENKLPIMYPVNTAVMELQDAWGYDGNVVATTLSTAKVLAGCPGHNRKLFYVYNFEWIFNANAYYDYIKVVPRLEIITRTPDYDKMFTNCFNRKSEFTLPEMNIEELWTKLNTKSI